MAQIDPLIIVKGLPNAGLCGIAIEHGILGPNLNIANGPIAGIQAVAVAVLAIRRGAIQVALTGGYDSLLQPEHIIAELLAGRLSRRSEHARSLQDGYVVREGAAMCVLESAEHARQRGANIYAEVVAVGETTGTAKAEPDSLKAAARLVIDEGGQQKNSCSPELVFGDLLGTAEADAREAFVARTILGPSAAVTAAVGAIGFTGAACGAFSLVHAARAISEGRVPPTVGSPMLDRDWGIRVVRETEERSISSVLVWRSDGGMRNVAALLATNGSKEERE